MPTDRARKTSASRKNTRRAVSNKRPEVAKRGVWFIAGLLTGVIATLTVQRYPWQEVQLENPLEKISVNKTESVKPRFDFYDLLKESEVIVAETDRPALELPPETAKATEEPQSKTEGPQEVYLLQVGSFKSPVDADSLRAALLLINLEAKVEKVSPRPGEVWHRVMVGPMATRSEVTDARSKLASNGIDSLLLKRNKSF